MDHPVCIPCALSMNIPFFLSKISGVPWPMAEALTKKYPTPAALMEAYDECAEDNRGSMIVGFEYGGGKRVNKGVSEAIAALYNYRGQFE